MRFGARTERGATVQQSTLRPRLRIPDAMQIFGRLLEPDGLRLVVSQAGRYSSGALELWGGLPEIASDLRDQSRLAFLEAYRKRIRSRWTPGFISTAYAGVFCRCGMYGASPAPRQRTPGVSSMHAVPDGICLDAGSVASAGRRTYRLLPTGRNRVPGLRARCEDSTSSTRPVQTESRGFLFAPEMDVYERDVLVAEVDLWMIAEAAIIIGEAKTTDRLGDSESEERRIVNRLVRVGPRLQPLTSSCWQLLSPLGANARVSYSMMHVLRGRSAQGS